MTETQRQVSIVGCGDLGQRLARCLGAAGYRISGINRSGRGGGPGLDMQRADFRDPASLAAALATGCDVLVTTLTPASYDDDGYRDAYVGGTAALLQALATLAQPPRLLLFVSSTSVYGQQQAEWVDEQATTEPAGFSGRRMLEAEALLAGAPCQTLVLRCSGIYGPGRNRLLQRVAKGTAKASHSFSNRVHADDCAAAMAHLIQCRDRGQSLQPRYLVSDDCPALQSEVVEWLASRLGAARPTPAAAGAPSGKRCRNQRLRDTGFRFAYPDYRSGYSALLATGEGLEP